MSITRFKSSEFYVTTNDPKISSPQYRIVKTTFTNAGKFLIKQYYEHKYHAQITFMPADLSVADQFRELNEHIKHLRSTHKAPHRHAFIVQQVNHAITIVYLSQDSKEGIFEEGILYADSLGESKYNVTQLHQLTGITIYSVKDARQSDGYSCFTDAFVFARDITGKDPPLGTYRISDLLFQLKVRADKQEDGHYHVRLPNILLKTAQKSPFVTHHQHIDAVIHKTLRLGEFRDRYTDQNASLTTVSSSQPVTKNIASYMRVKGNKYAKVIQLQYYLNEIEKEVDLSDASRRFFVERAKAVLRAGNEMMPTGNAPDLFELANAFCNVQLHMREHNHANLHADLSRAADFDWFPTIYEMCKDALDIEALLRYSIASSQLSVLNALVVNRVIDPNKLFEDGDNALTIAVEKRSAMAVELLLKHGADPALNIDGTTPLHMALNVTNQDTQVIKAFLDHGAKSNVANSDGDTPLHLAVRSKINAIDLLLDHGADPNVANSDGDTPLHLAVRHNSGAIDLLLECPNINPSIKNRQDETPLDLASAKKLGVYKQAAAKMRTIISAQKGSKM